MKSSRNKIIIAIGLIFAANTALANEDRVIYGTDNRLDIYQVTNPAHRELARSTAMLVTKSSLRFFAGNGVGIWGSTYGTAERLCKTEPFYQQKAPGFCSGFLVGSDIFVTAGHCIETAADCADTHMVFDYNANADGSSPESIHKNNVYSCKKIISRALTGSLDYAVVQLDRAVLDRKPLKYRTSGKIEDGTPLVLIGHPSGLPSKVADGASVRENFNPYYFEATTDSYGGNSGSAVFNGETGEVEGILVRGEDDFVFQGGCNVSKRCTETSCRGEDVSRSLQFAPHIPVYAIQP